MNLTISGHHLEVTPAIRAYVAEKLERVKRHFDHVINVNVILQVDKLVHKVEANLHVKGHDFHAHSEDTNMYAAIDLRGYRQGSLNEALQPDSGAAGGENPSS